MIIGFNLKQTTKVKMKTKEIILGGAGTYMKQIQIYLRSIPKSNTSTFTYVDGFLFHLVPVPTRTLKKKGGSSQILRGRKQSHLQMSKMESRTISVQLFVQLSKCSHKKVERKVVRKSERTKNVNELPDLPLRLWDTFMR